MKPESKELAIEVWTFLQSESFEFTTTLHKNIDLIEKIRRTNSYEFIIYNFKTYSSRYLEDLFINTPFLWESLSLCDIMKIIKELIEERIFEGIFSLITLFGKYFNIDLTNLILKLEITNLKFRDDVLSIKNIGKRRISDSYERLMINSDIDKEIFIRIREKLILNGFS